jgi:hypothetical protein
LPPFAAFEKTMEKLPDLEGEWKFFEKGQEKPFIIRGVYSRKSLSFS